MLPSPPDYLFTTALRVLCLLLIIHLILPAPVATGPQNYIECVDEACHDAWTDVLAHLDAVETLIVRWRAALAVDSALYNDAPVSPLRLFPRTFFFNYEEPTFRTLRPVPVVILQEGFPEVPEPSPGFLMLGYVMAGYSIGAYFAMACAIFVLKCAPSAVRYSFSTSRHGP